MNPFSSLTNRIFVATALLAVLSIGVAIYIVNRAVTRQGAPELQRGIDEAATLVDQYRKFSFETFGLEARLIADLPVLKAAVDTRDPATLEPIAREYQNQLANKDLFAIADNRGRVLVRLGTSDVPDEALAAAATIGRTEAVERDAFWPEQRRHPADQVGPDLDRPAAARRARDADPRREPRLRQGEPVQGPRRTARSRSA